MVGGRLLGVSTASLRSFSRRPRKKVWQRDSATTRGGLSFPHAVPNIIFLARMAPPVGDSVAFARRRRRRPSPPFERGRAKEARHRDTHTLAPSRPPATCRVAVLLLPPPLGQRPLYQEARSDDGASSPPILLRSLPGAGRGHTRKRRRIAASWHLLLLLPHWRTEEENHEVPLLLLFLLLLNNWSEEEEVGRERRKGLKTIRGTGKGRVFEYG